MACRAARRACYRGDVPSGHIVWTGHTRRYLACNNDVLGERLEPRARLFIAIEDQFESLNAPEPYGRVLLWKSDGSRWAFYDDALADDSDAEAGPYPPAAKQATTTQEILAVISGRVPDTATVPSHEDQHPVPGERILALLLVAFTMSFVLAVGPLRRLPS